jgi:predicted nucleotidyltransferase
VIAGACERIRRREEAIAEARAFADAVAARFDDAIVVLFGSYARGDFHDGSDLDVVVVSDELPDSPVERERVLYELSPGGIDIFAYRPAEFRRLLEKQHPTVFSAAREGHVLRGGTTWKALLGA